MNKTFVYIIILVLAILNILLLYKTFEIKKERDENNNSNTLSKLSDYYYEQIVVHSQLNNKIELEKDLILTDLNNRNYNLKSLIKSGNKVIMRNNEDGCGMCIEHELKTIEKYSKAIGIENIIVITTHGNARKLKVFKETNNISFKIYFCPSLNMPFEKATQKPFIFTINSNLITSNFFIPEVTKSEISEKYYSAICTRYFNHNSSASLPL